MSKTRTMLATLALEQPLRSPARPCEKMKSNPRGKSECLQTVRHRVAPTSTTMPPQEADLEADLFGLSGPATRRRFPRTG